MLTRLVHRIASHPLAYDLIQRAAGASVVRSRLRELAPSGGQAAALVIDIGAGTGLYRAIWPEATRYICLDLDWLKLEGFRAHHADAAVQGDAGRLPFAAGCADVIACTLMSHHLDDDLIVRMIDEAARVLKPGGQLLFADPVWRPTRWPGRLLWKYDRGANPRSAQTLRALIEKRFTIEAWNDFAVWHAYIACRARVREPNKPVAAIASFLSPLPPGEG